MKDKPKYGVGDTVRVISDRDKIHLNMTGKIVVPSISTHKSCGVQFENDNIYCWWFGESELEPIADLPESDCKPTVNQAPSRASWITRFDAIFSQEAAEGRGLTFHTNPDGTYSDVWFGPEDLKAFVASAIREREEEIAGEIGNMPMRIDGEGSVIIAIVEFANRMKRDIVAAIRGRDGSHINKI